MKKIIVSIAVALIGVMSMNAQEIAKSWEFRADVAYGTDFKGDDNRGITPYDETTAVNLGVAYNLNENWSVGVASGFYNNVCHTTDDLIPVLADVTYRCNCPSEKWNFFVECRGGYGISITDDVVKNGKTYAMPNAWTVDVQPGVYCRLSEKLDLKISLGYMHINDICDKLTKARNTNALVAKVGIGMRK